MSFDFFDFETFLLLLGYKNASAEIAVADEKS